jgi:TonB family protein
MGDYRNDIDKYLRGEMTPAEMNALEKKALEDPFLADALEGAQQLAPEDFDADMNELQGALNARVQKKSGGWIWAGRIAAGLLLLVVSTYLIVFVFNKPNEKASENLALNKQQEQPSISGETTPLTPADSTPATDQRDQPEKIAEHRTRAEKLVESQKKDQAARLSDEKPQIEADAKEIIVDEGGSEAELAEEEVIPQALHEGQITQPGPEDAAPAAVEHERKKELASSADDKARGAVSKSTTPPPGRTPSNSYNVDRKIIRGKVSFAEDGMALPGVNVLVKGSNEGTVTDNEGNYEIAVEATEPTLLFSFIGFTNKEMVAKSDQLDVQLDADVSELSEVVVVGYGADGSLRSAGPTVMELAAPEGGRKAFKQYLEQNLHYPEQALKNEVEGRVTIQFSIGMTGQLTDFRVIKGIGFGCDEEVIRLIKAGPKWHPTKKNEEPMKDRVRVRMRFALPKK